MEVNFSSISRDYSKLELWGLDLYNNFEDRELFRKLIKSLLKDGDILFFSFFREEDLTDEDELESLNKSIRLKFNNYGKFKYLKYLDTSRFSAIASIEYDMSTPNFIIDLWKYFYSCDFFISNSKFTFDDYFEFVLNNGESDLYGFSHLDKLAIPFMCFKGIGGGYLVISYPNNSDIPDKVLRITRDV